MTPENKATVHDSKLAASFLEGLKEATSISDVTAWNVKLYQGDTCIQDYTATLAEIIGYTYTFLLDFGAKDIKVVITAESDDDIVDAEIVEEN